MGKALLSPAQIRGARGMLDWSMADLARSARLSVSKIKRMEMAAAQPISDSAFNAVRSALEAAGLRFLSGDGGGEGVWLVRA